MRHRASPIRRRRARAAYFMKAYFRLAPSYSQLTKRLSTINNFHARLPVTH